MFSPNTSATNRTLVYNDQVTEAHKPCKYLGLPMSVGRKKVIEFKFLSERISQKLQGWRNMAMSNKLILLKTAA